ncbi:hypothetical protein PHOSAC3_150417 [Mesotoga infera]|nr:hypothetical protein PHOSAC3_150417 [Mesotoga infera]
MSVEGSPLSEIDQLQVPDASCELHVRINSIQTDVRACGGTPAIEDQSSQG